MVKRKFFDVRGFAPSAVQIRAEQIRRLPLSLAASAVLPIGWTSLLLLAPEGPVPLSFWLVQALTVGVGVWFFGRCSAKFDVVGEAQAEELLKLCSATGEGQEYRNQVVHLGRKFVVAEMEMLEWWNDGIDAREATQKLYDPAVSLSRPPKKVKSKASDEWEEF